MEKRALALLLSFLSLSLSVTPSYSQESPAGYASLLKKLNAGYVIPSGGSIRFWFEEEYSVAGNALLSYKILDAVNREVSGLPALAVQRGYNNFSIDVSAFSPGFYVLEVSNAKNEKWYLRFKVG